MTPPNGLGTGNNECADAGNLSLVQTIVYFFFVQSTDTATNLHVSIRNDNRPLHVGRFDSYKIINTGSP